MRLKKHERGRDKKPKRNKKGKLSPQALRRIQKQTRTLVKKLRIKS